MWSFAIGLTWAGVVAWLIFRAVRQYGRYEMIQPTAPPAPETAPPVEVIVPARNEEANIARCIANLLAQDYPPDRMHITVLDDNSTDATSRIVQEMAQHDQRCALIQGAPLPPGWLGKPWAVTQAVNSRQWAVGSGQGAVGSRESAVGGLESAVGGLESAIGNPQSSIRNPQSTIQNPKFPPDWLCFIDADTFAQPALISTAVSVARDRGIDMLSLEPFQELGSFWERLVMPAGFFLLAFSQDLGRVNDSAAPDAAANGQFILIRRSVYDAIGGHASVRRQIAEDSALARRVKGGGYRLAVIGAEKLLHTRMYRDLPSLWEGLTKTATLIVGGIGPMIFFSCAGLLLAGATLGLPVLTGLALRQHLATWNIIGFVLAMLGSLAMWGVHIGGAIYFRIPFWYGILFPAGYALGAAIGISSAVRHRFGKVAWKGRVYASPDENELQVNQPAQSVE